MDDSRNLTTPIYYKNDGTPAHVVVLGEVLWDLLHQRACLGGAPLNFSVHCKRLGHRPILISAVGDDDLGNRALREIADSGLDVNDIQHSSAWPTGTASVAIDSEGQPTFQIQRPAAYDDVKLTPAQLERLARLNPPWLYFGTLFPSQPLPRLALEQTLKALPDARRFYDVNLRPGFDSPDLIATLMTQADVIKLNESEAEAVGSLFGLPTDLEAFCRTGSQRFGWTAVCITLGAEGCAMLREGEFYRAKGRPIVVADTVGAGDAFAAALLHGLVRRWPIADIAQFANRVGALVASRTGAIPAWDLAEVASI
jgi:fructokinase